MNNEYNKYNKYNNDDYISERDRSIIIMNEAKRRYEMEKKNREDLDTNKISKKFFNFGKIQRKSKFTK